MSGASLGVDCGDGPSPCESLPLSAWVDGPSLLKHRDAPQPVSHVRDRFAFGQEARVAIVHRAANPTPTDPRARVPQT